MTEKLTNLIDIAINEFNYILDFNLSKERIVQVFSHIPQIAKDITYEYFVSSFGSNVPFVDKEKAFSFINHVSSAVKTKDYTTQVVELRFENYENKTKFDWSSIKCIYEVKNGDLHAYIISRDITVEKENEIKVIRSSQRDPLSGLVNRFGYSLLANQAILQATYNHTKLAVFFLDIDNFKKVNDSFGHNVGDKILLEASNILTSIFSTNDIVCRYGGDEFVIVVNNFINKKHINELAKTVCKAFSKIELPNSTISISCSIGISFFPDNSIDLSELIKLSDIALYYAKSLGKNRFVIYDENNKEMKISNTAAKQKNEILNSNEFFDLILNEIEKGILIIDAETYKIVYVNNKFKTMFDIDYSQTIIGKKCFEALYNYGGPCSNCNLKGQNLEYKISAFKNKQYLNKTRMIEWNNNIAYINFFIEKKS